MVKNSRKSYLYTTEKDRQIYRQEIIKMLKSNIIRISMSPYSSPCILVNKPDGSKRFCINFKKLNSKTVQDVFPLPRIDDILDR